jgi:hypothetical protein
VGSWHNFELVKYNNETSWIARVWDYKILFHFPIESKIGI